MDYSTIQQNWAVASIVSFLLGAAASYFVWWWLNHRVVPALKFAQEVCRYNLHDESYLFVCAFKNVGRRKIIDLDVFVRVGLKNFNGAEGWLYFDLATTSSSIPELAHNRRGLVRIFDEREPIAYREPPSVAVRKEMEKCKTLVDVFAITDESLIQLHVFGFDGFSGARRHFLSPVYSHSDIRTGRFEDLDIVNTKA